MTKKYSEIVDILSTKTDYIKAISDVAGESKVSTVTMALKQMGDAPTRNQIIGGSYRFCSPAVLTDKDIHEVITE